MGRSLEKAAIAVVLGVCGNWAAHAQQAPEAGQRPATNAPVRSAQERPARAVPADPSRMEALLKAWEGQSTQLRTLKLGIYRIDKTPDWEEEDHYEGTAAFERPGKAHLNFRKVQTQEVADPRDPKKKKVSARVDPRTNKRLAYSHETIVFTGEEVWHYNFPAKQVFVYTLDKDARQRALQEGPLPFLFDMRVEQAHRRYEMALQGETDKLYFVVIRPKLQDDKEEFSKAFVFLERKYLLPSRIVLFSPDGRSTKDFRVESIQANKPLEARLFKGVDPGKPWTLERNPGGETSPKSQRKPVRGKPDQTARRGPAQGAQAAPR